MNVDVELEVLLEDRIDDELEVVTITREDEVEELVDVMLGGVYVLGVS